MSESDWSVIETNKLKCLDEKDIQIQELLEKVKALRDGLREAMEWNWLDEGAEDDVPRFEELHKLAKD